MSCHSTSGGIVSTSLARAVTGLSEKEIQHMFHALKREAAGMAAPSELDVSEWRARQYELLTRMKRMSDTRRDKMRDRLFRSRSESVPDGPTFHAWRTIEARARQEKTLAEITTAVDLEPPGSQAHLYELGEDGRPTKVWYASYGSNLHRDRFMNYIKGGKPEGSSRTYDGCTDKTEPEADIPIRFAGARPHFALTSRVWHGGIAFIDAQKGESAQGLGRAYEISIDQFDEVVAQENGLSAKWASKVPLTEALTTGRSVIGNGSYETILHIGDYNGAPVLTFTAPFTTREALTKTGYITRTPLTGSKTPVRMPVMTNKPSPAYLRMIGGGLQETFGMDEVAQADYLRGCPGGDKWTRQQMVRILRGEQPDPPRVTGPENPKSKTKSGTVTVIGGKTSTTKPATTTSTTQGTGYGTSCPNCGQWRGANHSCPPTGKPATTVTAAFSHAPKPTSQPASQPTATLPYTGDPHIDQAINDAVARTADGEILADLRERGLFPASDLPTPPKPQQRNPGNTNRNTKSKRGKNRNRNTGNNGGLRTRSTGAIQPKRQNGKRVLAGVKTYNSVEEQQHGVRRWRQTVDKYQKERDSIATAVETLETGLGDLQADPNPDENRIYATGRNLNQARQRLQEADQILAQANERYTRARNQQPTRYYDPTVTRTLAEWRAEDDAVVARHRTTEAAYQQARNDLTALRTNPDATDEALETAHRKATRLEHEVTGYENRLQETHEIITGLLNKKK